MAESIFLNKFSKKRNDNLIHKGIKRVVIAGCRDYNNYTQAKEYINFCLSRISKEYKIIIISGGCSGADMLGERYAKENGFKIEYYPADWKRYGKSAGPRRNWIMAEKADFVICFWDGHSNGTKSMIDCALQCGKPIRIKKIF